MISVLTPYFCVISRTEARMEAVRNQMLIRELMSQRFDAAPSRMMAHRFGGDHNPMMTPRFGGARGPVMAPRFGGAPSRMMRQKIGDAPFQMTKSPFLNRVLRKCKHHKGMFHKRHWTKS